MIVTLEPGDDLATALAMPGDSVVVMIRPGRDAADGLRLRTAIAAAALDRAPRRINAVHSAHDTTPADANRAAAFLASAPAITGQVIELS